jgi:hypothetical protein
MGTGFWCGIFLKNNVLMESFATRGLAWRITNAAFLIEYVFNIISAASNMMGMLHVSALLQFK